MGSALRGISHLILESVAAACTRTMNRQRERIILLTLSSLSMSSFIFLIVIVVNTYAIIIVFNIPRSTNGPKKLTLLAS